MDQIDAEYEEKRRRAREEREEREKRWGEKKEQREERKQKNAERKGWKPQGGSDKRYKSEAEKMDAAAMGDRWIGDEEADRIMGRR